MDKKKLNRILLEGDISNYITDSRFSNFIMACLDKFPSYFWICPSSNEKYHPVDERSEGGLVLHTRRVIRMCLHFSEMYGLNLWQTDVLICAAILHDSFARGLPESAKNSSDPFHPLYPEYRLPFNGFADRYIEKKEYVEIMLCVAGHMGRFGVNDLLIVDKLLPRLFHEIDFITSRENVIVNL